VVKLDSAMLEFDPPEASSERSIATMSCGGGLIRSRFGTPMPDPSHMYTSDAPMCRLSCSKNSFAPPPTFRSGAGTFLHPNATTSQEQTVTPQVFN
jgi:hypothetical protein